MNSTRYRNRPDPAPNGRKGRNIPEPDVNTGSAKRNRLSPDTQDHSQERNGVSDEHQSGDWQHTVTNQDEQKKVTNSDNDVMGEHEAEGI